MGREHRGHAQPVPALVALEHGGLLLQAPHGQGDPRRAQRGPDRQHRLPQRRDPDAPAARPVRRGGARGRRAPGHVRARQRLPRADGPRHRHREAGPRRPAAPRQAAVHPADRHQRLPLQQPRGRGRPRRPHLRRVRQAALRHQPAQVRRRRLLHQVRRRDARAVGRPLRHARGVRQHPRDRRALRGRVHRVHRRLHGPRRRAGGRDRGLVVPQGGLARHRGPLPRRPARPGGARPGRDGARDHLPEGLLRLLPRGRRLHQLGQGQRHPRRSRPRLGCRLHRGLRAAHHRPVPPRARPVLRAVPQPRAPLDARLRHRLRRRPPRRGHPLRQRQVRRRARRADRDVRPAQGQGRHQGRRPRARPRLRDRRPHHQGATRPT